MQAMRAGASVSSAIHISPLSLDLDVHYTFYVLRVWSRRSIGFELGRWCRLVVASREDSRWHNFAPRFFLGMRLGANEAHRGFKELVLTSKKLNSWILRYVNSKGRLSHIPAGVFLANLPLQRNYSSSLVQWFSSTSHFVI